MLSVFLVDDHRLFRAGIRAELAGRLHIAGEAGAVDEAVEGIRRLRPDVVLLDVHLPDGGGKAVLTRCRAAGYEGQFLALSASDDPKDVVEVIRAGARGYVTKTVEADELVEAVRRVAAGDAVFSPKLAGFVLDAFSSIPVGEVDADLARLTAREREVLQLVARGYTYKEIAERLVLSVKTSATFSSTIHGCLGNRVGRHERQPSIAGSVRIARARHLAWSDRRRSAGASPTGSAGPSRSCTSTTI